MLFKIAPEIFKNFPDIKIGIISVLNIQSNEKRKEIEDLLIAQQEIIKSSFTIFNFGEHPYIQVWREAYKKFGAKPKEHLSSIENLVKRILKGQKIRSINSLVDLCNVISLKYLIPAGGKDLDKIVGNIELAVAFENEKKVLLLGELESSAPKLGEVIYKDESSTICRRWNWKEIERTKLTEKTQNAILVLEALNPVESVVLEAATYELANLIKKYCAIEVSVDFLDKDNPEVKIKENSKYLTLKNKEFKRNTVPDEIYKKTKGYFEIDHSKHDSKEHELRLGKIKAFQKLGIQPWPDTKEVNALAKKVIEDFEKEGIEKEYKVAGRIMTIRFHGKTAFADLQDSSGKIQIYIKQDNIGDKLFKFFKDFIDIGDILWCRGTSFKTKMGEITLNLTEFSLLSKCLHPLPEKFHGIVDIEIKYRQRYLDLITSTETKDRFLKRSKIIKSIRNYLDKHEYVEVETPMLHPIAGGAAARPFITHHNALDSDFYLRIAPELYLKRLVIGGFDRVYEINRNFRNEGISTRHNPEFTMLEFYTAYQDYHFAMNFVEDLIRDVAQKSCNTLKLPYGNYFLDFSLPFQRLSVKDAVKLYANITDEDLSLDLIDKTLKKHCIATNKEISLGEKIFALFEKLVEPKIIQPTFIIDFPIEISPLSKRDSSNPEIASRFELFVASMELANGFNELNDPFDQAQRFYDQLKAYHSGDEEAHQFDADYIRALEYGLPPTVGVGIGIDRLIMVLTNTISIKEVILFPTLKKRI